MPEKRLVISIKNLPYGKLKVFQIKSIVPTSSLPRLLRENLINGNYLLEKELQIDIDKRGIDMAKETGVEKGCGN